MPRDPLAIKRAQEKYREKKRSELAEKAKEIRERKKIEIATIISELQKDNFRGLPNRVQDHIDELRAALNVKDEIK